MERVFTEDVGSRYKAGEIRDYPLPTWLDIGRVIGKEFDAFSEPVIETAQRAARSNRAGDEDQAEMRELRTMVEEQARQIAHFQSELVKRPAKRGPGRPRKTKET